MAKKPPVNKKTKSQYTDWEKKDMATHGVGAVGSGPGGKISPEQMAVARDKISQSKAKTSQYNAEPSTQATSKSEVEIAGAQRRANEELRNSTFKSAHHQRIKKMYNYK
jgi:hypothetical protein